MPCGAWRLRPRGYRARVAAHTSTRCHAQTHVHGGGQLAVSLQPHGGRGRAPAGA